MMGEDDDRACQALALDFPRIVLAPAFDILSQAKSNIAAFSSGVPMAHSHKFSGLFGTFGSNHPVDCTGQTGKVIKASIMAAYDQRAPLATGAAMALARGREKPKACQDRLKTLVEKIDV